jgi:hypothetical protein
MFNDKDKPPPTEKPPKEYLFSDKKSVPVRAKVTLHPSEEWTNLMMSFHPVTYQTTTQTPPRATDIPVEETTTQSPGTTTDDYYPTDIELPWYPYYPPNKPEETYQVPKPPQTSPKDQWQHQGQSHLNSGHQGQTHISGGHHEQGHITNGHNGQTHVGNGHHTVSNGYQIHQGQNDYYEDYHSKEPPVVHGQWIDGHRPGQHHSGANYGFRPPSHPHLAQSRISEDEIQFDDQGGANTVKTRRGVLPVVETGSNGEPRWYSYHITVPANPNPILSPNGEPIQRIRVLLPPGVSKDQVLINVQPVPSPNSNHQAPILRHESEARLRIDQSQETEERQSGFHQESASPRSRIPNDPEYLQRILGSSFLNQPPQRQILVPQGPVGQVMEARITANRRNEDHGLIGGPTSNSNTFNAGQSFANERIQNSHILVQDHPDEHTHGEAPQREDSHGSHPDSLNLDFSSPVTKLGAPPARE